MLLLLFRKTIRALPSNNFRNKCKIRLSLIMCLFFSVFFVKSYTASLMVDVINETVLQLYLFLCRIRLQTPSMHNTIDRARKKWKYSYNFKCWFILMARFTDQRSRLKHFSVLSFDWLLVTTNQIIVCHRKLLPSCSHPRIKNPENRAVGIEKIILKLLQHRRHNVQLKATSVSNMPRSGKCANSSIKCPWCQNSFFSAAKQLPSSNPQLSGNLHQRLESWHKRANLRETTAGYKPSVSHQATRIIWSLTCLRYFMKAL